jgi:hypothetical protein
VSARRREPKTDLKPLLDLEGVVKKGMEEAVKRAAAEGEKAKKESLDRLKAARR